jgi:hypothetical protein
LKVLSFRYHIPLEEQKKEFAIHTGKLLFAIEGTE